jgi:hypothetical protein
MMAVGAIEEWLQAAKVRHTLIGAVAVAFLGKLRTTRDVDAMIEIDPDALEAFLDLGREFGIVGRTDDTVPFARQHYVLRLVYKPRAIDIDLSLAFTGFELEAIGESTMHSAFGLSFPLPRAEALLVMKAFAGRTHDLGDIEGILDRNPNVKLEVVRNWLRQLDEASDDGGHLRDFEEILERRRRRRG